MLSKQISVSRHLLRPTTGDRCSAVGSHRARLQPCRAKSKGTKTAQRTKEQTGGVLSPDIPDTGRQNSNSQASSSGAGTITEEARQEQPQARNHLHALLQNSKHTLRTEALSAARRARRRPAALRQAAPRKGLDKSSPRQDCSRRLWCRVASMHCTLRLCLLPAEPGLHRFSIQPAQVQQGTADPDHRPCGACKYFWSFPLSQAKHV